MNNLCKRGSKACILVSTIRSPVTRELALAVPLMKKILPDRDENEPRRRGVGDESVAALLALVCCQGPLLVEELNARGKLRWLVGLLCAANHHGDMKGSHWRG